MGRSITVGRRRSREAAAATVEPVEAPGEADLNEVYEDVLALAAEPLAHEGTTALQPLVRAPSFTRREAEHARREKELGILAESLAVVRDITSVMERGSTPAVAAHEQAIELAREQSRQAFELARAVASREQPVPDIHMHLPEHRVDVKVEGDQITLPPAEQHFHAGDTHVAVPEQPVPQVDVFVPRQEPTVVHVAPAAATIVNEVLPAPVHVHEARQSATRGVRVEIDEHGHKVYVPVEVEVA